MRSGVVPLEATSGNSIVAYAAAIEPPIAARVKLENVTKGNSSSATEAQERALRERMIEMCRRMNSAGLNQGTSGNLSVRCGDAMLITPSGIAYEALQTGMLAKMSLDAAHGEAEGPLAPSSEWRFHRDILRLRTDANAVIHMHPPYCTTLAMARLSIPAAHYMVATFGGDSVRCAEYHTFGTAALSRAALRALEGRTACLLANHGMITVGSDLNHAMHQAEELEALARQYYQALQIGGPIVLSRAQMAQVHKRFKNYGPRDP